MNKKEVLQLALDTLDKERMLYIQSGGTVPDYLLDAMDTLEREEEKPEPEPVAWMREEFEKWAKQVWGIEAYRHTSATSGEWEAWQAAIAAKQESKPVAYAVLEGRDIEDSAWGFIATWEEICHEHINDAISEHNVEGAGDWRVVPLYLKEGA